LNVTRRLLSEISSQSNHMLHQLKLFDLLTQIKIQCDYWQLRVVLLLGSCWSPKIVQHIFSQLL
jgi:hypothetical protein